MQLPKLLLSILLLISMAAYAKINFEVALLRGAGLAFQSAITLIAGQKPIRAYQDDTTYIEAELLSETDDMPHVRLTVATKSEHGMFLVRGMPEVTSNIVQGLGMASIQCNSPHDNFTLLVAMAKV